MTASLIAFIISGIGILAIIFLKMLLERLGLLLFWPDTRAKVEVVIRQKVVSVQEFARTFDKRMMYIVLHYVLVKLREFFVYLQHKIDERLIHLVNLIKGKRMTEIKGSASHFLHDIHRFKDKFRRQ